MSDAAFKTAAYPAYTITELRKMLEGGISDRHPKYGVEIAAEIERRERVATGDVFSMTAAERLRFYRSRPGCEAFNAEAR